MDNNALGASPNIQPLAPTPPSPTPSPASSPNFSSDTAASAPSSAPEQPAPTPPKPAAPTTPVVPTPNITPTATTPTAAPAGDPTLINKKKKSRLVAAICGITAAVITAGITFVVFSIVKSSPSDDNDTPEISQVDEDDGDDENASQASDKIFVDGKPAHGAVSSPSSPAKVGDWGLATFSLGYNGGTEESFAELPVRVTRLTRGQAAASIVEEYDDYKLDISDSSEPLVIDYEVDLSTLKIGADSLGVDYSAKVEIKGLDGDDIIFNNTHYLISGTSVEKDGKSLTAMKPSVYKARAITSVPIGCNDYLVKLIMAFSLDGSNLQAAWFIGNV